MKNLIFQYRSNNSSSGCSRAGAGAGVKDDYESDARWRQLAEQFGEEYANKNAAQRRECARKDRLRREKSMRLEKRKAERRAQFVKEQGPAHGCVKATAADMEDGDGGYDAWTTFD